MINCAPHIGLLTPQVPNRNGIAAAKLTHYTVQSLRSAGCRVTVFTAGKGPNFSPEDAMTEDVVFINHSQQNRFPTINRVLNRIRPFGNSHTKEEITSLRKHCTNLDWIIADETYSGWLASKLGTPSILHSHCLRTLDWEGNHMARDRNAKIRRMLKAESEIVRRTLFHATASTRVAQKISEWNPAGKISPVSVSVELKHYAFIPASARLIAAPTANLFGSMPWAPTAAAGNLLVSQYWPKIKARLPTARLQLVGKGAKTLVTAPPAEHNVEIHDWVQDIRPFWRKAGVMLYPSTGGSGIKLKILEAMAYGIPIVTTPSGAEGVGLVHGESALIAENDTEFINYSIELLKSHELQEKLRHAGRKFLDENLQPHQVAATFLNAGKQLRSEPS